MDYYLIALVPVGYLPWSIISQFATKTAAIYCYLHVGKGVLVFDVEKDVWRAAPLIYLLDLGRQASLHYSWSPIGVTAGQGDIQEATVRGCCIRLAALCLATDLQLWW